MTSIEERQKDKSYDLFDDIFPYFKQGVNEEMFELGIDYTGLYMFTFDTNIDEILYHADSLITDLDLKVSDVVIVILNDSYSEKDINSLEYTDDKIALLSERVNFVNPKELEGFIRLSTGRRPNIFSDKVIESIKNCFYEVEEHTTELEEKLAVYSLPENVINALIKYQPMSTQECRELGVPHDIADTIFDIMINSYKKEEIQHIESGISVFLFKEVNRKCILSLVITLVAAPLLLFNFWPHALVLAIIAMGFASSANHVYSNSLSKVCLILSISVLILACTRLFIWLLSILIPLLEKSGYIR